MPVGATMVSARVAPAISAGDHGTTYGGNLLACRAALTVLDELDRGLLDHVRRVSSHFADGLRRVASESGGRVVDVRGAGLMGGLEVKGDALAVVRAAMERGLLVNRTAGTVLRLLPPYVVTEAEVAEGMDILSAAIHAGIPA
jgi:acetylornithine/succinyldiaminopimelate/putrescine aminotransferase